MGFLKTSHVSIRTNSFVPSFLACFQGGERKAFWMEAEEERRREEGNQWHPRRGREEEEEDKRGGGGGGGEGNSGGSFNLRIM